MASTIAASGKKTPNHSPVHKVCACQWTPVTQWRQADGRKTPKIPAMRTGRNRNQQQ